ncbi:MAG: ATP-binding cassette domain-containing protein [Roseburia inulinivorans]
MSLQVEIEKKLNDKVLSVSFDTEGKQGITGILGASGCGKSMTLKCIAGIETPDRGKIVLNGRVLFDSGKKINLRVQDRHVGYLFQNYALFPNMTVEENIAAGFQISSRSENDCGGDKKADGRLYGTAACDRVKILLSGKIIRRAAAACGAGENPCVRPGGFDAG